MANILLKIVLLILLLAWSGHFVYRLCTGIGDAWKHGQFGLHRKGTPSTRVIRASARPIEFWFTMSVWLSMLVVFAGLVCMAVYGIFRTGFTQ